MAISEVTRRNILDYLLSSKISFHGQLNLIQFLKRIFALSEMPSTDSRFDNAAEDIWQHMVNNYDWDYEYLLNSYLNMMKCDDKIFLKFLEEVVHPIVQSDVEQVTEMLDIFNDLLAVDGYRLIPNSEISGRPIYKAVKISENSEALENTSYEVVLSYASEDRTYVEQVAAYLKGKQVKVFYDQYEETTLWGKDLVEHLDSVYGGNARYCVMFISEHYAEKIWTQHERRSAFAKAVTERKEYILPVRFDSTEIPGLRSSVVYIDLSKKTPEQLSEMIIQKLQQ